MHFLVETCVSRFAVDALRDAGHDVLWVPEAGPDPGDEEVLARAVREDRILVTLDKDFGDLVFVKGQAHPAIVRLVAMPVRRQADALLRLVRSNAPDLQARSLIVIERDRVRIRRPE